MVDRLDLLVYETAHESELGMARLADQLDIGQQVLINKVNYNNDKNKLSLREAIAMMKATGNISILEEIAWQLGFRLASTQQKSDQNLLTAIVNASADHGKVHQTIEAAFDDNRFSPRELTEITQEINDAVNALHTLLSTIEEIERKQQRVT
ncbi:phage regulatory protein CII [Alteromonadaceae bacterium 2753L.S.0a.02]|nr:phage regulatory protein CII [Alteromonadaceae bacterium 2753L.S.0a.02]